MKGQIRNFPELYTGISGIEDGGAPHINVLWKDGHGREVGLCGGMERLRVYPVTYHEGKA